MKAKKGFNLRNVCGQNLIVAEGKENMDFSNIISMNESSALLWKSIQGKDFTVEDLAQILQDNYQIDDNTPLPREQALQDAATVAKQWKEAGILED
jgi:predicted transcriptional regulator